MSWPEKCLGLRTARLEEAMSNRRRFQVPGPMSRFCESLWACWPTLVWCGYVEPAGKRMRVYLRCVCGTKKENVPVAELFVWKIVGVFGGGGGVGDSVAPAWEFRAAPHAAKIHRCLLFAIPLCQCATYSRRTFLRVLRDSRRTRVKIHPKKIVC